MSEKWERSRFQIAMGGQWQRWVDGWVRGNMCYFKDEDADAWNVTHIPSGMALCTVIDTWQEARQLAELVSPHLPTTGELGKVPPQDENYKRFVEVASAWIHEHRYDLPRITIQVGVE